MRLNEAGMEEEEAVEVEVEVESRRPSPLSDR